MTDRWLPVLNNDSDRLICRGPGRCFSKAQFRKQINLLQAAISEKGYRKWVLYDEDGFQFLCAMFALLASGRDIFIPAARSTEAIKHLLETDVGLIGSHSELHQHIDIETSPNAENQGLGMDDRVTSSGKWGRVTFCTSGSSGRPKMIAKSAEQLYLEAENFNRKWRPSQNTWFIPLVTHLHIYGLTFAFLLPLLARAGFYLPRNAGLLGVVEPVMLNPGRSVDGLAVVASPTVGRQAEQIRTLAEPGSVSREDRPAPVTRVFCAGDKLTDASAGELIALFDCPVTEIFGSTETGAVATRTHQQQKLGRDNLWRLLPGVDGMAVKGEFAVWGGHAGGSREAPVMTGDEVNFVNHRQFKFLGRGNQICKIEGKRISLPYLVEILEGCELVTGAVVLPVETNERETLLCGIVLSRRGESGYCSFGKSATDLLIRKHLGRFLDPVLVPRSIRYLDEMPRNEMGKLPRKALVELLVNPVFPTLPLVDNVETTRDALTLSLRIPMELKFLRGHFETKPIVPGVVLLHWVYHFVGEYWNLPITSATVTNLKFSKPVTPGCKLSLTIRRVSNGVKFLYQGEPKIKFSSGQIPFTSDTADV